MTDHAELENMVAAFVLGAAEDSEENAVRAHLAECAGCRQLVVRLQRAADVLPLAADLVEAPDGLKARILAAAAASPPSSTTNWTQVVPLRRATVPGRAWSSRLAASAPAAVAALVLAVVGLGAWNVYLTNELGRRPAQPAVASTTIAGRGPLTGAQAKLVDFKDQSIALVTFSGMPAPPPGMVYEVWLIPASGAPEGVAAFLPEADGTKALVLNHDLRQYKVIAVTLEQGPSGVPMPTQSPSLAGSTV